jgi:hypothetical protein
MCKKKRIYPSNTLYSLVILFARVVLLPLLHAAGFQKQLIIAFLQKGVNSVDKSHFVVDMPWKSCGHTR